MTHEECIAKNRETGNKYIKLSKDTLELSQKFKKRLAQSNGTESWDFERLHHLYEDLGKRFAIIGSVLINIQKGK